MAYTKKIVLNTIIQIIGKIITTTISVIMLAYLARYLGVFGYGQYTTVFAFLTFFAIVADMGFYTISIREMSHSKEDSQKIMGNIFSLRIIFAIFFLLLAPVVGYFIPQYSSVIKICFWIASFSNFFTLLNQLLVSIFQVNFKMSNMVISDIVSRIVLFMVTMVFIKMNLSLEFFVLSSVIANFSAFAVSLALSRKFLKFSLKLDIKYCKYILREAVPIGIIIVLGLIYFKIDTIMLSIMKDSTAVGIYGAPYKILEIFITLPSMFMGSVFPLIARYYKEKDERIRDSFYKSFDFISIMAFPILIGTFVLAKQITLLVLGGDFIASALVLQYLVFAVFIIFYGTIMGNFVIASNLQKKLLPIYIISVFVNIFGNLILIPSYSYIGSSISTILTEAFVCFSAYLLVYNNLKLIPNFKVFFKSMFSALLMGLLVYLIRDLNIIISIFSGAIVYCLVMYVSGGINRNTIREIIKN